MSPSTSSQVQLTGRTVLISGAGANLGRAIAVCFAEAGANVVVTARRAEAGVGTLQLVKDAGGRGIFVPMDVTQAEDVKAAVAAALSTYGGLDIVLHNANAGDESSRPMRLEDLSDEAWHRQAGVAWDGAFHLAQASFKPLRSSGDGRFLVFGSAFGLHGAAMNPSYSAFKGGDRGFVKALAREWGPHGITVNAIDPSAATAPTDAFFAQYPAVRDQYLANFPMRHLGRPKEDVAFAIVALCSRNMGYVTGQTFLVDGGLYSAL